MSVDPMLNATPTFGPGWSYEENDGLRSFRWMGFEAVVGLPDAGPPGLKYLQVVASHMFPGQPPPLLEVFVNGRKVGRRVVAFEFSSYVFPFEGGGEVEVRLEVDRIYPVPGDGRDHGIMVSTIAVIVPEAISRPLHVEGWHPEERNDFTAFRWMRREARVLLPPRDGAGFLTVPVFSEYLNLTQVLEVWHRRKLLGRTALLPRWTYFSFPLDSRRSYRKVLPGSGRTGRRPEQAADELVLRLNKVFPLKYHARDPRELGACVGPIAFHDDPERHRDFVFFHANAVLNHREMVAGRTKLRSFPTNLGIDLYGRCNIKPPCVYCLWDRMKVLEGEDVEAAVDEKALESYGPFFGGARTLVNCSFGEPLLHPRFTEVLEYMERRGKIVELSTNGQAFTARTIKALAGKQVTLYLSLDAASEATYAKIRNDRWSTILPKLRELAEARRRAGNLPRIFMVFIPMRVNRGDLEAYFRLAAELGADSLIIRPLIHLENPEIRVDRGGHHFDYAAETLSPAELEEVAAEAERLSRAFGVQVQNQLNFGTIQAPGEGG